MTSHHNEVGEKTEKGAVEIRVFRGKRHETGNHGECGKPQEDAAEDEEHEEMVVEAGDEENADIGDDDHNGEHNATEKGGADRLR